MEKIKYDDPGFGFDIDETQLVPFGCLDNRILIKTITKSTVTAIRRKNRINESSLDLTKMHSFGMELNYEGEYWQKLNKITF